jgi:hypothetical protein
LDKNTQNFIESNNNNDVKKSIKERLAIENRIATNKMYHEKNLKYTAKDLAESKIQTKEKLVVKDVFDDEDGLGLNKLFNEGDEK